MECIIKVCGMDVISETELVGGNTWEWIISGIEHTKILRVLNIVKETRRSG
jgi:hypothetical protein